MNPQLKSGSCVSASPTPAFTECVLRDRQLTPARFLAPLAGYTHSAFRRLVAGFGGCGAFWTEMLAGPQILQEDFTTSPWLRRSPGEKVVIYQLMVRDGDPLDRILDRLAEADADGVDLNLACDALSIRACEAGSALFDNLDALRSVLETTRRLWPRLLTVKIRLGSRRPDWEPRLKDRLAAIETAGVDALIVHPRFFEDKLRRRARLELLSWIRSLTRLPLIANGDLEGPADVHQRATSLSPACAIMLGRIAVAQPWIFATWDGPVSVDPAEVWQRLCRNATEDFPPLTALRRVQMFTRYYAANFAFGHRLRVEVANATSLNQARERAESFFATRPALLPRPTVAGL
jgi:tRNA-dihydrouridine synthase B